jgi:hypothetical protein
MGRAQQHEDTTWKECQGNASGRVLGVGRWGCVHLAMAEEMESLGPLLSTSSAAAVLGAEVVTGFLDSVNALKKTA